MWFHLQSNKKGVNTFYSHWRMEPNMEHMLCRLCACAKSCRLPVMLLQPLSSLFFFYFFLLFLFVFVSSLWLCEVLPSLTRLFYWVFVFFFHVNLYKMPLPQGHAVFVYFGEQLIALLPAGIVARPADIPPELWRKTHGGCRGGKQHWGMRGGSRFKLSHLCCYGKCRVP